MRHRAFRDAIVVAPEFSDMQHRFCPRWRCREEFKGRDGAADDALKTHLHQDHRVVRRIMMFVIPMSVLGSLAGWFIPRVL